MVKPSDAFDFAMPLPVRDLEAAPIPERAKRGTTWIAGVYCEVVHFDERVPLLAERPPQLCRTFLFRNALTGGKWLVLGCIPVNVLRYVRTPN